MWVACHHFIANCIGDIVKAEQGPLAGHLGVIHGLQQQITQFVFQFAPVLPGDRIGNLICFFDSVRGYRGEILLNIPWAARGGVAQGAHNFQQSRQTAGWVFD